MRILRPNRDAPSVHIADISKSQLARIVNDQTAEIRQLREQVQNTGRVLIAVTLEPEAFQYKDGHVTVDRTALEKVKQGMQLTFNMTGGTVVLGVVKPEDERRIVVPQIVGIQ